MMEGGAPAARAQSGALAKAKWNLLAEEVRGAVEDSAALGVGSRSGQ